MGIRMQNTSLELECKEDTEFGVEYFKWAGEIFLIGRKK